MNNKNNASNEYLLCGRLLQVFLWEWRSATDRSFYPPLTLTDSKGKCDGKRRSYERRSRGEPGDQPEQARLLTFNDRWGTFTLPMTRRRRGREGNEPLTRAAFAAGEALGVPVRLVQGDSRRLASRLQSGRQVMDKHYRYDIFHVEPHPDFDDRLQIREPHVWLSPHMLLAGAYEPISESARTIVRGTLKDFGIPARVQHSSVVIIKRDDPEARVAIPGSLGRGLGLRLAGEAVGRACLGERRRPGWLCDDRSVAVRSTGAGP